MSKHPFFILFHGRSGSTHLVSMLDCHPDISCEHEVFHLSADIPEPAHVLADLYKRPFVASGFKYKYPYQVEVHPGAWSYLLERRDTIRVIGLTRKNLLKIAISRQNLIKMARAYGKHNITKGDEKADKLEVDTSILIEYMEHVAVNIKGITEVLDWFDNTITIHYEDILYSERQTTKQILDFLEVDDLDLQSGFKKFTPDGLRDAIANYEDVEKVLKGTKFERFLSGE